MTAAFDLVVIGGGPAALAVVARILESRPAALYTEEEHAHLHWLQRGGRGRPLLRVAKSGRGAEKVVRSVTKAEDQCHCDGGMRILIIDQHGDWLANWNRLFNAYQISHLRSPMFFHPGPSDIDALLAYAERNGRAKKILISDKGCEAETADMVEIPNCVGKEISKHKQRQKRSGRGAWSASHLSGPAVGERDRRDYFTPSSSLFGDFIKDDIVNRYGLDNGGRPWSDAQIFFNDEYNADDRINMAKGDVSDVFWQPGSAEFCIQLKCGSRTTAKAVVCAVGAGPKPAVPPFLRQQKIENQSLDRSGPGWYHSSAIGQVGIDLPPHDLLLREKAGKQTTLVVIGGGLTSAQICDVAIRGGISKVVLLLRSYLKVKPFDVGLEWLGRYANLEQMRYWQEDDLFKRHKMLLAARNGGSVNPVYAKILKKYEDEGKLRIHHHTEVTDAAWKEESTEGEKSETRTSNGHWELQLCTCEPSKLHGDDTPSSTKLEADFLIAATGASPQFSKVSFLHSIREKFPIAEIGGLPALSESLQYEHLPLFFTGAFSALQIGPGAFNLAGMRAAADRIALRLHQLAIDKMDSPKKEPAATDKAKSATFVGEGNPGYTHFSFHHLSLEIEA